MKKLIFISIILFGFKAFGQFTPLQSQYLFNGIGLNPAYTGSEDAFSVSGSFRGQWLGLKGAPRTETLTAHTPLKNLNSAVGLQVFADQIGVDRNTGFFASYAYRLRFENSTLAFGVAAGMNMVKTNFTELSPTDEFDPLLQGDTPLSILPDFSFGIHYYGDRAFASFAIPQFLSHKLNGMKYRISNDFSDYNYTLGGGYKFDLFREGAIKPSILAKYKVGRQIQFDFNLMVAFNPGLEIGLAYRTSEAAMLMVKVNPTKQFQIMYSLGVPMNSLLSYTYGSHEIGLKYNFKYITKAQSPRFLGW